MAATQIAGLAAGRYMVKIEPLASMTTDELVEHVGPTLQRYLDGSREAPAAPTRRVSRR